MPDTEPRRRIRSFLGKPAPKPIPSGLAFTTVGGLRNAEALLRWQGAQLAFALNPPAFIAVAYKLITRPTPLELFVLIVSCVSAASMNLAWYRILIRDGQLLNFWNDKAEETERVNGIEGGVEIFTSDRYQRLATVRSRLQNRLEIVSKWVIVAWAMLLLVASVLFYLNLRS